MNEILFTIEAIIIYFVVILIYKLFQSKGLICWITFASVLSNIIVSKTINLFSFDATLGNILFASNFLATDILVEKYSKEEAQKAIYISIVFTLIFIIITQMSLLYIPSDSDYIHSHMKVLFSLSPRICLASISMYFLSHFIDIFIYDKLANKMNYKYLWIRKNVCTIASNCFENFGFVFIAFIGIFEIKKCLIIAITTSILEILLSILDTPFLYLAKKIKEPIN